MDDGIPKSSELLAEMGPDAKEAFDILQKDAGDEEGQK